MEKDMLGFCGVTTGILVRGRAGCRLECKVSKRRGRKEDPQSARSRESSVASREKRIPTAHVGSRQSGSKSRVLRWGRDGKAG